jgi:uncharacterized protein YfaT (DUF1175 family)
MLGDEAPLTIDTDAPVCANTGLCCECIDANMATSPNDSIMGPIRLNIDFVNKSNPISTIVIDIFIVQQPKDFHVNFFFQRYIFYTYVKAEDVRLAHAHLLLYSWK